MKNILVPRMQVIKRVVEESPSVKSFIINKPFKKFVPGQFIQVTVPGYGEIPLGITSNPKSSTLKITVNNVGNVTKRFHELGKGDVIGVRGPYGNGWPLKRLGGRRVIMIAGGVGIVPIKPLIHHLLGQERLTLLYGAKTCEDLLFHDELKRLKGLTSRFVVEEAPKTWKGEVGFVTKLCGKNLDCEDSVALVCGPPAMTGPVTKALKNVGFRDDQVYLSLERLMQCGVGFCEHCRVGTKLVCADGPVFRLDEIKDFYEVEL